LVRRVDDPSDRRSVKAEVTDEGRRRHTAAEAELARLHEDFAANVAAEDRVALRRLLTALK
jgi:DNA-binding MarR family transcriptional regulator